MQWKIELNVLIHLRWTLFQEVAIVCFAIKVYETKSENSWKMEL